MTINLSHLDSSRFPKNLSGPQYEQIFVFLSSLCCVLAIFGIERLFGVHWYFHVDAITIWRRRI